MNHGKRFPFIRKEPKEADAGFISGAFCFFTFDKAKLPDVVAMVGRVDDVGVVQLPHFHQHLI